MPNDDAEIAKLSRFLMESFGPELRDEETPVETAIRLLSGPSPLIMPAKPLSVEDFERFKDAVLKAQENPGKAFEVGE
jgi:hypothetical protein